jgi:hypothetical protein
MNPQAIRTGHKTGRSARLQRLLRAANSNLRNKVGLRVALKPGPFLNASELKRASGNHPGHALITGLLVVYPVFASVAVVIAGMWLLGASNPI